MNRLGSVLVDDQWTDFAVGLDELEALVAGHLSNRSMDDGEVAVTLEQVERVCRVLEHYLDSADTVAAASNRAYVRALQSLTLLLIAERRS